jgi:hypothetical protein
MAAAADADPVGEVPLGLTAHLGPPRPTAAVGSRPWWRRHRSALTTTVGVAAALAGVAMTTTPSGNAVYVDARGYHLGANLLREVHPGIYEGGAVVLISRLPSGAITAAGSLDLGGAHAAGSCRMARTTEHCTFEMGGKRSLTADDTLVVAGGRMRWQRRYSDGQELSIDLPTREAVPVPVPLGR